MKFPDSFLDQLRDSIRVSEIVGRKFKLRKQGQELVAIDNPSLSVNDGKKLWKDFGNGGGKAGDIFSFLEEHEGLSFIDAVKECARIVGIPVPGANRTGDSGRPEQLRNGHGVDHSTQGRATPDAAASIRKDKVGAKREIDRTYDYTDESGALIYQVVRFVWEDDGKRKKSFAQRRPAPDEKWIWGLDVIDKHDGEPLEFMTKAGRDWQRYDAEKFEDWRFEQRATFEKLGNLRHSFYKLVDVLEALADSRPIFWAEGEKDAETLWAWGVPATTNSGGAKNVNEVDVSIFQDADVIIPLDNDQAGRERADLIGHRLKGIAKRVRVLDFVQHWPDAPKGADVTDWRDQAGGTVEQLYEIAKGLPDWKPGPPVSKFGRISWRDQERPNLIEYEWWVKGIIPKHETIAVVGATQTGKSFETFNLCMHIARGIDYRGCRTKQGLVVYCAMEGGKGFRDRMRGYRSHHGLPLDGIPFEVLTRRADLFSSDVDMTALIAEIKMIAAEWSQFELALVVIDTYSASTPGLKENAGEDISRVRQRVVQIENSCNCGVLFVDHTNAAGERVRGHSSKTADIEAQIDVSWVTKREGKELVQVVDDDNRKIRRILIHKQREGEAGQHWDFVLKRVEVRKDADGDPVSTCVSIEPARSQPEAPVAERKRGREGPRGTGYNLYKDGEAEVFKAILAAIAKSGENAPAGVSLPYGVRGVARWSDVGLEYKAKFPNDDGETPEGKAKYADRVKKTLYRARKTMLDVGLIGVDKVGGEAGYHVAWPTGKSVWGPGLQWPEDPGRRRVDTDGPVDDGGSITDFF